MFGLGPATKIYIAVEGVDMRKGFDSLFGLVRDRLGQDPLSGHMYLFSNRARSRLKVLVWDGSGLWVCAEPTNFTLHLFQFQPGILKAYRQTCRSIHQAIPSAAMFRRRVRRRRLVELPSVVIIEMRFDEPMFRPPIDRLLMDTEAIRHLRLFSIPR